MNEKSDKADAKHDIAKFRWLDPYFGDLYLDEITRDQINEVSALKKREVSAATVNRYLALLRSVLRAARDDWEWIDKIPSVKLLREPQGRVRWITQKEARRLVSELPVHLAAMARFALATGLRANNVTQLRWDQVDLPRARAWINAGESKTRKAIPIPLNSDALSVLADQQGKHDEYVFVYKKHPVKQTSTKAWYLALERAGIEDFRWHDLRHTWASWHVQSGTSLHELMELGGWKTYKTVLRYAHLAADQLSSAAGRIDKVFDQR
jgi:integrase